MSILEYKNVTFQVGKKKIIDNISLEVDKGDYISIVGPSGSGKSTFLKLASDLISPSSGDIYYKGKNYLEYEPRKLRQEVMMCFQSPYLFGDKVVENLEFPYQVRGLEVDKNRIYELLEEFKMPKSFLEKEPSTLSGGEQQRIALIRSIIFKPDILLLDEVTSSLDVKNTKLVEEVIKKMNDEGTTILWVTHDLEQSRRGANKLIRIVDGKLDKKEVIG